MQLVALDGVVTAFVYAGIALAMANVAGASYPRLRSLILQKAPAAPSPDDPSTQSGRILLSISQAKGSEEWRKAVIEAYRAFRGDMLRVYPVDTFKGLTEREILATGTRDHPDISRARSSVFGLLELYERARFGSHEWTETSVQECVSRVRSVYTLLPRLNELTKGVFAHGV